MASRGRGGRGGRFQQQPLPNRGGSRGRGRGGGGSGGRGGSSGEVVVFRQNDQVHKPKDDITKLANATLAEDVVRSLHGLNLTDLNGVPRRPAYGTKGPPVTLWANFFELLPSKTQPFHQYDISFIAQMRTNKAGKSVLQEEPKGKKLERLIRLLLLMLPVTVPKATDYRCTLITSQLFPFREQSFLVRYYAEHEQAPADDAPVYNFRVKFTNTHTFQELLDYLSSTDLTRPCPLTKQQIITATNIVLASGMKSNPQIVTKKNRYFPVAGDNDLVETWILAAGLGAFRGFFMSVRAATGRILLNVQVQHVVVWQTQSFLDLLSAFTQERTRLEDQSRLIAGLWVHVRHLNNRLKRIAGLAHPSDGLSTPNRPRVPSLGAGASTVEFWRTTPAPARYITVQAYFAEKGITLSLPHAPVVNVGTKKDPVYMPGEQCTIKSRQTYDRKLTPTATANMISGAVRTAPENAQSIVKNGIKLLRDNSKPIMTEFGVRLDPSMLTVIGRVLPSVAVRYAAGPLTIRDASWNMRDARFTRGATVRKWAYLLIRVKHGEEFKSGDFENPGQVATVVSEFHKELKKCGIDIPSAAVNLGVLNIADPQNSKVDVDSCFANISRDIQLVLVILPNNNTTIYSAIKVAGDIRYGFHTVSVIADKKKFCKSLTLPPNNQYYANVALKINLKLGGQNQSLSANDLGFVSEGKTMIVGLDVTHPSPGSADRAPSVSAIVASIGPSLGQWPATVAIQTGRKEMIEDLKDMFKSRLVLWRNHNGELPSEIIVYRDGVGDTMYDLVRSDELPLIQKACQEVYPATDTKANKPYITIIICGKRHHTRFYPTNENEVDPRSGGPKSGTIVDRGVTEARVWDYYFQGHAALQGTPRSAHYVVIHDEIFRRRASQKKVGDSRTAGQRAADDVEHLTNALGHMYGRATKAVSLCTPAYYADLVCTRARVWLSRMFENDSQVEPEDEARDAEVLIHPRLKDTMFYI